MSKIGILVNNGCVAEVVSSDNSVEAAYIEYNESEQIEAAAVSQDEDYVAELEERYLNSADLPDKPDNPSGDEAE